MRHTGLVAFATAAIIFLPIATASANGLDQVHPYENTKVDPLFTGSIPDKPADADEAGDASQAAAEAAPVLKTPYAKLITRYAEAFGVQVSLANAVVRIESNYNAKARGRAGEIGLMQIKPATARMMGYSGKTKGLYKPETNIKYGMKYLAAAQNVGDGTTCGTILKYNAGHAARHMNPVSKRYCGKVLSALE